MDIPKSENWCTNTRKPETSCFSWCTPSII